MKSRRSRIAVLSTVASAAWLTGVLAQSPQSTPPAAPPAGQGAARAGGAPQQGPGRGFTPVVTGPSAPVPPEVAMLRPTTDEARQINDAMKRLVDADTSPAKPLLTKYASLLPQWVPRLNVAATFRQTTLRMGARHEGFVERAKQGDIDLLLHGDSITDWWVQGDANKAMFDKYFGDMKTANFAIAGDRTEGVLWGLKNGEGQGYQPKAAMVMIGTNNTGGNTFSAAEIAEGIGAIVLEMRNDFPNAKILLLAIFPRGLPGDAVRDKIAEINKIISKLDDKKHVFYLDIGAKFLDERGV